MNIEVPKRLKNRPQYKGLPVPFVTFIGADGKPDFRITDAEARLDSIFNKKCQLCAEPLGKYFFFAGGPKAAEANQYFEPAAHLDCLLYAMQVCPFIVGKMEHADPVKVAQRHPGAQIHVDETYTTAKNPLWVIKKADDYQVGQTPGGTLLVIPKAIKETKPLCPEKMDAQDWVDVRGLLL